MRYFLSLVIKKIEIIMRWEGLVKDSYCRGCPRFRHTDLESLDILYVTGQQTLIRRKPEIKGIFISEYVLRSG
ncbi:MAG: hypothetical protein K2G85_10100 [Muribaculaceae bacterium]|nr:hypothetical protein [Muribaculaceae bacterium]